MPDTPPSEGSRRPLRRFLVISLRMLLVLVAVLAIWLARVTNRARLQAELVAELKAKKCQAEFDYQHPEYEPGAKPSDRLSTSARMKAEPPGPKWLRRIVGDEYFRNIVYVSYYGRLDHRSRPGLDMSTLGPGPDEELLRKLGSLGALKAIALNGSDMKGRALAHVGRQHDLENLLVYDCPNVTDESVAYLQDLRELKRVNIGGCPIGDRGVSYLAKLPQMEVIQVHGGSITDACFAHVRGLPKLDSLILENPSITDAGLAHLRGTSNLLYLDVASPGISDAGLAHVATLRGLTGLTLEYAQITDEGLAQIAELKSLKTLNLAPGGPPLTDRALVHLRRLTELTTINIGNSKHPNTQFTNAAVLELLQALPKLNLLRLEPPNIEPEFVTQLKQARPGLRVYRTVR